MEILISRWKIFGFLSVFAFAAILSTGCGGAGSDSGASSAASGTGATKTVSPGDSLEDALREIGDGTLILSNGLYELDKTLEIAGSPTIKSESGKAVDATIRCATQTALKISGSPTLENVSILCEGKVAMKAPEAEPIVLPPLPLGLSLPFSKKVAECVPDQYKNDENVAKYCETVVASLQKMERYEIDWSVKSAAVTIVGGSAKFVGCDICGSGFTMERVVIEPNSTVIETEFSGVAVQGASATPTFEDCQIHRCKAAIAVVDGATPKFVRCQAFEASLAVGAFGKGSGGEFVDCEFRVLGDGICVASFADPTFKKCKVSGVCAFDVASASAVNIAEDGAGKFIDCQFVENSCPGVWVKGGGRGEFTGCEIRANAPFGVLLESYYGWVVPEYVTESTLPASVQDWRGPKFVACQISDCNLAPPAPPMPPVPVAPAAPVAIPETVAATQEVAVPVVEAERAPVAVPVVDGVPLAPCPDEAPVAEVFSFFPTLRLERRADTDVFACVYVLGGRGEFVDCEIGGNSDVGVAVEAAIGNPKFTKCKIRACALRGVVAQNGGRGEFVDCEISETPQMGVQVSFKGDPSLTNCKISACETGVHVGWDGLGRFDGYEIFQNSKTGASITFDGEPKFTKCAIRDQGVGGVKTSGCDGVYVWQARGEFDDCDFSGNSSNVCLMDGAPTVKNCRFSDALDYGVYFGAAAKGTFEGNEFDGSGEAPWFFVDGAQPTLNGNKLNGEPLNAEVAPAPLPPEEAPEADAAPASSPADFIKKLWTN